MRAVIVVAMVCWCGLAFASGQPPQPERKEVNQTQQQHSASEQQAPKPDTRGSKDAPLVVNIPKSKSESAADQQDRAERSDAYRDAWRVGWATVCVLAVQLIAFIWQGWQLKRTVSEMESATKATESVTATLVAQNRPWLTVSPSKEKGQAAINMTWDGDELLPVVYLDIKNIGSSPAFNITDIVELDASGKVILDFPRVIAKFAPAVKRNVETNNGTTLFPGEPISGYAIINSDFAVPRVGDDCHVICGVSYTSAFDKKKIYTTLILLWVQRNNPSPAAIPLFPYHTYAD